MSEAAPRRERSAVEGSFEGNVRMPQTYFAVSLFGLEAGLAKDDPKAELAKLLAPIPIDERLIEKTRKANAQHALYPIPIELTPERVRNVEIDGNLNTLYLAEKALLAIDVPYPTSEHITDENGAWATEEQRILAQDCLEQLTPERAAFLRKLVGVATGVLREPEMAAKLLERKAQFRNYMQGGAKDYEQKMTRAAELGQEAYEAVCSALNEVVERKEGSEDERRMAAGFADGLDELFDVSTNA